MMTGVMTSPLLHGLAANAVAAASHPTLTAAGETCDQTTWQAEVPVRCLNIARACQGAEVRYGAYRVRVKAGSAT